ncbi:MAG: proline dehydrogenase family protein [Actinomycetia bacterium]|nr:proline dehydrogenase family protein [Actinomycetes bacterium]
MITETPVGRAVAERFVAGDTLESAIAVTRVLNASGMRVSLDHLGEHVSRIREAEAARDSYLACLGEIARNDLDANISIKLTQLGMGIDNGVAARNLDEIASAALGAGTTVTIDMEESGYTQTTLDLYVGAQSTYGNLGVAVQSYLFRTAADLDRVVPLGGHIRLCKGAYAEPKAVAYQTREEVDASFDRLGALLMETPGVKPAIASHDDTRLAKILASSKHRSEPWEFQMLYGIRRDRQAELVAMGHEMRIYVPYGEAWYPYLTRRMAERPPNLLFFMRALIGG